MNNEKPNIMDLLKNEKVEWKTLGEIAEICTGSSNTNEQIENGKYPFFVRSKYVKRANKYEFDEEAVIIPGEGGIGEIFHYINGKYALHQRAYRIHLISKNVMTKYLFYYMRNSFYNFIVKNSVGATVASIRVGMIQKFEIPIPSIETQEKIVKILDKFTNYVTELQTELQKRTYQYEFYRDKLLNEKYLQELSKKIDNFENNRELRVTTLGEIGEFVNGSGMPKTLFNVNGTIGAIHYGHIYTKYNIFVDEPIVKINEEDAKSLKKVNCGDLVIARTSENIDDVMKTVVYLGDKEVVAGGHTAILKHNENGKYLSYLFNGSYDFIKQKNRLANGVKVIEISVEDMKKIKITLPSIEIQNIVVQILDKFQKLVMDTKGLLPKEIEERQKQYEYYREKLLIFDSECGR
ncbi:restriction endonuclease subunit S, partial [Dialister micraerophilus]|uniref:restriction endonuclease subunit S n=1 Tax=Dialister micraerophilus TaxID=309120 RepID=UPI0023F4BDB6